MPSSSALACSSKSKVRQNRLRSARPQARLIREPNGAWITSCMPPDSSKNRSKTISLVRGHQADGGQLRRDVGERLLGGPLGWRRTRLCSHASGVACRSPRLAAVGNRRGQVAAQVARARPKARGVRPGRSPSQKGMLGGAPSASRTAHLAAAHVEHAPRSIAQQKDVAGQALDGEILVDRADERFLGLGDDAILGRFGNRAAGGDRRQPRAAAGPQAAVDQVAVQVGAALACSARCPSLSMCTIASKSSRDRSR